MLDPSFEDCCRVSESIIWMGQGFVPFRCGRPLSEGSGSSFLVPAGSLPHSIPFGVGRPSLHCTLSGGGAMCWFGTGNRHLFYECVETTVTEKYPFKSYMEDIEEGTILLLIQKPTGKVEFFRNEASRPVDRW